MIPLWAKVIVFTTDGLVLIALGCIVRSLWREGSRPWKP